MKTGYNRKRLNFSVMWMNIMRKITSTRPARGAHLVHAVEAKVDEDLTELLLLNDIPAHHTQSKCIVTHNSLQWSAGAGAGKGITVTGKIAMKYSLTRPYCGAAYSRIFFDICSSPLHSRRLCRYCREPIRTVASAPPACPCFREGLQMKAIRLSDLQGERVKMTGGQKREGFESDDPPARSEGHTSNY